MTRQDLRSREFLSDYDYGDRLGYYTILGQPHDYILSEIDLKGTLL